MIALIDYGAGNLTSVRKALSAVHADTVTPRAPEELASAQGIIVPGVGHFGATRALDKHWREAIGAAVDRGATLFGICLGMQWLFEGSDEEPGLPGLGVFPGFCVRLPAVDAADQRADTSAPGAVRSGGFGPQRKVPHVGWNSLHQSRSTDLLADVDASAQVYFTHSYAAPLVADTAAVTDYGQRFSAAVQRGRLAGVQFHPEKSADVGLQVLRNWLRTV